MVLGILSIIAVWTNDVAYAWQVVITVFASLHMFAQLLSIGITVSRQQ